MGIKNMQVHASALKINHFATQMKVSAFILAIPLYILEHFTNSMLQTMGLGKRL